MIRQSQNRHLFLIDPLDKIHSKKDSSLLIADTYQQAGLKVCLLFPEDFCLYSEGPIRWKTFSFSVKKDADGLIDQIDLGPTQEWVASKGDNLHFRLDPPFNSHYLKTCWALKSLEEDGLIIHNSPRGILLHNEKLMAFQLKNKQMPTFIGNSSQKAKEFIFHLAQKGFEKIIVKPLEFYQGIGVECWDSKGVDQNKLQDKIDEFQGMLMVQPFWEGVHKGEIRAIYYRGQELGSILKVPKKGSFLANIGQGASYRPFEINNTLKKTCVDLSQRLAKDGVDLVSFDILGDILSEVNITCPGLLVEASQAHQVNMAKKMLELLPIHN